MQKVYTQKQAFLKAAKYCAYQERSQQEVRERLAEYGCYGDDAEAVICRLIEENFINEERFAKAFAGGKFRLKHWGKRKIVQALKQKGISDYCIRQGIAEIDPEDYEATLKQLLEKKYAQISRDKALTQKQKLLRYALSKGYENQLIWQIIPQILED